MHDTYIVGSARGKARNASISLVGIVNSFPCGFGVCCVERKRKEKGYGRDEKYLRKDPDGLT